MSTAHTETKSARPHDRESNTRSAVDDLRRDTAAVREDLALLKDDAIKATSHAAEHAVDAVTSGAESARELAESASKTCKEYHSDMCKTIRKNPTASVLVAAGIGVIAGKIISKF